MPSLHEIKSQIQSLNGLEGFLGRREINELPNILWPNETIAGIIQGTYSGGSGILLATNKRLIFVDKGFVYGLRVEDFSYDKISSIKYQTGLIMGELTILASGNNAVIKNVYNGKLRYFAETVRMIMSGDYYGRSSGSYTQTPPKEPQPVDVEFEMEKIETHKELGIINEDEYEVTRIKLLGQAKEHSGSRPGARTGHTPDALKWAFGILFGLMGLVQLGTNTLTGILLVSLGVFIIPPVNSLVNLPTRAKYFVTICWFIFAFSMTGNDSEQIQSSGARDRGQDFAKEYINKANKMIVAENYDSAQFYIAIAKKEYPNANSGAAELESQLANFISDMYFHSALLSLSDQEYSVLGSGTSKRFFSNEFLNNRFTDKLKAGKRVRLSTIKANEDKIKKERQEKERRENELKLQAEKKAAASRKWYEGGTLHDASIDDWKKATNRNKLATCADYALLLHPNFKDVDDLKPYALAISVCIDEGTVDDLEMFKDITVKETASMCILLIRSEGI